MNIDPYEIVQGLREVIRLNGSEKFFEHVQICEGEPIIEPEGSGFVIRFPNSPYRIRLYESDGALFGGFRDDHGNNTAQVWNPLAGRRIFNQVLEYLTAPAIA
jgi:hypothetical protein